jgi:hypothetical protein
LYPPLDPWKINKAIFDLVVDPLRCVKHPVCQIKHAPVYCHPFVRSLFHVKKGRVRGLKRLDFIEHEILDIKRRVVSYKFILIFFQLGISQISLINIALYFILSKISFRVQCRIEVWDISHISIIIDCYLSVDIIGNCHIWRI